MEVLAAAAVQVHHGRANSKRTVRLLVPTVGGKARSGAGPRRESRATAATTCATASNDFTVTHQHCHNFHSPHSLAASHRTNWRGWHSTEEARGLVLNGQDDGIFLRRLHPRGRHEACCWAHQRLDRGHGWGTSEEAPAHHTSVRRVSCGLMKAKRRLCMRATPIKLACAPLHVLSCRVDRSARLPPRLFLCVSTSE